MLMVSVAALPAYWTSCRLGLDLYTSQLLTESCCRARLVTALSPLSSFGLLTFCACLFFSERNIEITFDLIADVETNVSLSAPNLSSPKTENATADVDSYISACVCQGPSPYVCTAGQISGDDILNVCVTSVDSEVEVAAVKNLNLFQDNSAQPSIADQNMIVVQSLAIQNVAISSVTTINVTAQLVSTVIPDRFFQYEGAQLSILGDAQVDFARRSLVAIDHNVHPVRKAAGGVYAAEQRTLGQGVERPGYPFGGGMSSSRDDRQTDDRTINLLKKTSNFELTVDLVAKRPDRDWSDLYYDSNSGNTAIAITRIASAFLAIFPLSLL